MAFLALTPTGETFHMVDHHEMHSTWHDMRSQEVAQGVICSGYSHHCISGTALSTAGLHMLISACVCSPSTEEQHCPAVPAWGKVMWLGTAATAAHHWVRGEGLSDKGRLLCHRRTQIFSLTSHSPRWVPSKCVWVAFSNCTSSLLLPHSRNR